MCMRKSQKFSGPAPQLYKKPTSVGFWYSDCRRGRRLVTYLSEVRMSRMYPYFYTSRFMFLSYLWRCLNRATGTGEWLGGSLAASIVLGY